MALSMTARLLCAARHAYTVTAGGAVPAAPYVADIGYAEPVGFTGGILGIDPGLIDAALIGEAPDAIIIAFRGTLAPKPPLTQQIFIDWLNDCDAVLVDDPLGLAGKVHEGFRDALDSFWTPLAAAFTTLTDANPQKPIYLTGHSKGGPMANIAAMRLRKLRPQSTLHVCTFAGARAGDAAFAGVYGLVVPFSQRYEYADDIVPHLAPSAAFREMFRGLPGIGDRIGQFRDGYASVGTLHFIDSNGAVSGDTKLLDFERFRHLAERIVALDFATIASDHAIEPFVPPHLGYYNALYR